MTLHTPKRVGLPVICIGNLTAGGTGKTPTAVSIANLLKSHHPYFVSRGYGGKLHNILVNTNIHTPQEVGDEPLLLAREAPTIVNPNRYEAAQKASKAGAEIIIMDDGFQNPKLHKDLSFLVFDGEFGYGNGLCIPAGPLRENLNAGLKRADAVLIIGADKHNLASQFSLPIFHGTIMPIAPQMDSHKVIAFAGIGRPEKFYQSLRNLKFDIVATHDFPDHHFYTEEELQILITKAKNLSCELITTAKDFVKIPPHLREAFKVLEIEIRWQEEKELIELINNKLFLQESTSTN